MRRALEAVEEASPAQHELLGFAAEGLSPTEIAARTERSPGSVRVALHRARQRLATALKNEVARYCSSEEEFEEEMATFSSFLGPSGEGT
ncbi:MAG: sigma-70 family RNA polymerase sigma factor [Planctomycetes bacterium]|nr:sigma-70 family RNA polymerase sigma factor [Planctomycetota bacterium]